MKNGDIFYTFDREERLVKRMVCTEETERGSVYSVEITGTTTFRHQEVNKAHVFKTHEQAFDALKCVMKRDYETRLRFAELEYKRMYKNEVKK